MSLEFWNLKIVGLMCFGAFELRFGKDFKFLERSGRIQVIKTGTVVRSGWVRSSVWPRVRVREASAQVADLEKVVTIRVKIKIESGMTQSQL